MVINCSQLNAPISLRSCPSYGVAHSQRCGRWKLSAAYCQTSSRSLLVKKLPSANHNWEKMSKWPAPGDLAQTHCTTQLPPPQQNNKVSVRKLRAGHIGTKWFECIILWITRVTSINATLKFLVRTKNRASLFFISQHYLDYLAQVTYGTKQARSSNFNTFYILFGFSLSKGGGPLWKKELWNHLMKFFVVVIVPMTTTYQMENAKKLVAIVFSKYCLGHQGAVISMVALEIWTDPVQITK